MSSVTPPLLNSDINGSFQFSAADLLAAQGATIDQLSADLAQAQATSQTNSNVTAASKEQLQSLSEAFIQAQFQQLGTVHKALTTLKGVQIDDAKILSVIDAFKQAQESYRLFLIDKKNHLLAEQEMDRRYRVVLGTFSQESYGTLSVQRQEEVDAKLLEASGGCVTLGEISQKNLYFYTVNQRIAASRTKLNEIAVELKNNQHILDATDFSKVDKVRLKETVVRLLEARQKMDAEAEALNSIVPIDYKHLCDFIQRFIKIYGPTKLPKDDPSFIRGAGPCNQTVDEIYETYEKMHSYICKLQGQAQSFVNLWSGFTGEWNRVKDDLRKLSFMDKNQTVVTRSITGARLYAGKDANGVKTIHFRPIDSEMPQGWMGGWTSWALGARESSQPSSSSSSV